MAELTLNVTTVRQKLTDFIRQQVERAGFSRAVLGLSGGIDSALACCLAAEALGAQNVLAVRLPYTTSAPDSLDDAQRVIDLTGVQSLTIPITPMVEPLFERFPDMTGVRRGNIMARTRMVILFDQSAAFHALVVGTGNKTEVLLGYSTIYGDSACAFNPLGDLYKTQVRQLSQALGLPASILAKAPSADLWQGQTDEGDLGFTYAEVDRLLFHLVEERRTPDDCLALGFAPGLVQTVINRVRRNRFKSQLPPVPQINAHPATEPLAFI
jgi:NAD+ synthase